MPRAYAMSWEGAPAFRWKKMHRGTMFRVGCSELKLPRHQWTKELSADAANRWWTANLESIQRAASEAEPYADELSDLDKKTDYSERHGLGTDYLDSERQRIEDTEPSEGTGYSAATQRGIEAAQDFGIQVPSDLDQTAAEAFFGDSKVWTDRLSREKQTDPAKTVTALSAIWVTTKATEALAEVRSNESAVSIKNAMAHFAGFAGSTEVDAISAEWWNRWYVHCAANIVKHDKGNGGWSADTAKKYFGISRSFVRWLWETERIVNIPRNLTSKSHKFGRQRKEIPTFTNDEISRLLQHANGVHRLILLLMLNCGMTSKDVSDLKRSEVSEGRIIRTRSKMQKSEAGRTVSYKLWTETNEMLKRWMNTEGALALTTKSGAPWVWTETLSDGRFRKSDNVATVYNRIKAKAGLVGEGKSVKIFRKTSATRIKQSPHKDLRFWFLGHSEKTVADTHYSANSQKELDDAVDWLGEQYGLN